MNELSYLAEISEKLSILNDKLDIIVIILIFGICLHYGEKWFNIAMKMNDKGGKR